MRIGARVPPRGAIPRKGICRSPARPRTVPALSASHLAPPNHQSTARWGRHSTSRRRERRDEATARRRHCGCPRARCSSESGNTPPTADERELQPFLRRRFCYHFCVRRLNEAARACGAASLARACGADSLVCGGTLNRRVPGHSRPSPASADGDATPAAVARGRKRRVCRAALDNAADRRSRVRLARVASPPRARPGVAAAGAQPRPARRGARRAAPAWRGARVGAEDS